MQKQIRTAVAFLLVVLALAPLAASAAPAGVVNVNTASVQQLELLPRVGPSVAQRIVEHRKANGSKFNRIEDLMLVEGIGERTFALIKPYVALQGETTLKEKVKTPRSTATASKPAPAKPAPAKGGQG